MRDDPVALRSERMFGVFARYLAWRMSREFHGVRLSVDGRPEVEADRPLIVYSNHPSWWDPAMMIVLAHRLFPGRPGFAPMDQAAFERYGIFRRMGVFGIATDGWAGARRFLEVSERVLDTPGGMMWVNAEGTFTDARARPVALRPGVAHLARRRRDALLVPLAMEFGFWDESKPEALARFGAPVALGGVRSVREIDVRLTEALERTMDGLAADSLTRDPARFMALVRGRTGADLVYDGWRRAKSLMRGRRFDPAHGAGR
jgi:1-acyl-sn-glycerol-3-phosphate acyltransferase